MSSARYVDLLKLAKPIIVPVRQSFYAYPILSGPMFDGLLEIDGAVIDGLQTRDTGL